MEFKGQFWLPSNKEKHFSGSLVYKKNQWIELDLQGSLAEDGDNLLYESHEIIHGYSINGKQLTLVNCSGAPTSQHFPGLQTSRYNIMTIFVGSHFDRLDDLTFKEIQFESDNLTEWATFPRFKIDLLNEQDEASIRYKPPAPIQFSLGDGIKGEIRTNHSVSGMGIHINEAFIKVRSTYWISYGKDVHYDSLLELARVLLKFQSLATLEPTRVRNVKLKKSTIFEERSGKIYYTPIQLYFLFNDLEARKIKSPLDYLFTASKIDYGKYIEAWHRSHSVLGPVFDLLLNSMFNQYLNVENIFLNNAQALETFHRRTRSNSVLPKDQHKKRVDEICQQVPSQFLP